MPGESSARLVGATVRHCAVLVGDVQRVPTRAKGRAAHEEGYVCTRSLTIYSEGRRATVLSSLPYGDP